MLRLSKKTDYALILLSHLALATDPASAQEMAGRYHLPQPMVANILKQLATAGVIKSKRGQQGGYCLSKDPGQISVADIIEITDNPFSLVECVHDDGVCKIAKCCPTRDPLLALHERLEYFMRELTLTHIINHPQYNLRRTKDEAAYLS